MCVYKYSVLKVVQFTYDANTCIAVTNTTKVNHFKKPEFMNPALMYMLSLLNKILVVSSDTNISHL